MVSTVSLPCAVPARPPIQGLGNRSLSGQTSNDDRLYRRALRQQGVNGSAVPG